MPIKTHFLYIDEQGVLYQVGLGFLPFVPRAGEQFIYAGLDRETLLYSTIATFRVTKVTYEFYGTALPVSKTWENGTDGKGCQVNLYVSPADESDNMTQHYLQDVMEAAKENFPERYGEETV